jgi:hypothetical protein
METEFLERFLPEVVAGNVACQHNHRDAIYRSICHSDYTVCQPWSDMQEQYAWLVADSRIGVGSMRRNLLVPC